METEIINSRIEILNDKIDEEFGKIPYPQIETYWYREYDDVDMGMFFIREISLERVQLESYEDYSLLYPVTFPPSIHRVLKSGDLFLLTLGRKGQAWVVLYSSHAYEEMQFDDNGCCEDKDERVTESTRGDLDA